MTFLREVVGLKDGVPGVEQPQLIKKILKYPDLWEEALSRAPPVTSDIFEEIVYKTTILLTNPPKTHIFPSIFHLIYPNLEKRDKNLLTSKNQISVITRLETSGSLAHQQKEIICRLLLVFQNPINFFHPTSCDYKMIKHKG
ncbi:MAG: hypothetical protein HQ517_07200 [SAR324 cluster bacterium]|nr:hypothetical protein [SAR324 cluster bacterium]